MPETQPAVSSDTQPVLVELGRLCALTRECFERLGVPPADAQAVADVLVDADLHDVPSHGVQRIPIYMRRVQAGLTAGSAAITTVAQSGAVCRMDAAFALGPAAGAKALDHAAALARQWGVGVVAVGRSTHFGAAGCYARRAAELGLISVVLTNASKRMAPYASAEAFLGTNAIAIGVPLEPRPPFVLDMATSVSAQGKITRAKSLGEPIPVGIALDPQGRPTDDPAAALAGSLLPLGGPKGSGLALAITLLTVLLAGADPDDQMASLYNDFTRPQNTGHLFIAIDPGSFDARAEGALELIDRLGLLRPIDAASPVEYPGQRAGELARERRRHGLPVSPVDLAAIARACAQAGLPDLEASFRTLCDGAPPATGPAADEGAR